MKKKNQPISKLRVVLQWLDEHALFALTVFLCAFIPLYPKLPIADLLPGYIVRLRIEDLFIAITSCVWFVQLVRRKVSLRTPLTIIITAYLIVGLASSISAMYWTHTVPLSKPHILKVFLHYFRRMEYFSLFFIAFGAIKKRKHVAILLTTFAISTLLISLYGVGQKYLYFPVYSTMNREFSKGLRLYLTEHARVQSTFGGHYDFAAYLVVALPLITGLFFFVKNIRIRIGLAFTYLVGLWGLMMTSSRSSFLAYIAAITLLLVITAFRKGFWWFLRWFVVVYALTFSFMFLFGDLSQRFGQIFSGNAAYQGFEKTINDVREKVQAPVVEPPKDGISIDDVNKAAEEAAKKATPKPVIDQSDTLPSPTKEPLPADVFVDVPDKVIATKSAEGKPITIVIPRVFSENAHRLGLSAAIRLDTLWPFAIRGFLRNPLLGSGYSTLTKYTNDEFTEAESTDNDFLRTLGETGALGFITFYGSVILGVIYLWRVVRHVKNDLLFLLATVLTSVTLGLLINAVYIDVFVSSKVIEVYWILMGSSLAYGTSLMKRKEA